MRRFEFKRRSIDQQEPCGAINILCCTPIGVLPTILPRFNQTTDTAECLFHQPCNQRSFGLMLAAATEKRRRTDGRTTMKPNVRHPHWFIKRPVTDLIHHRSDSSRNVQLTASIRRCPALRCSRRFGLRAEIAVAAAAESRRTAAASKTGPCSA